VSDGRHPILDAAWEQLTAEGYQHFSLPRDSQPTDRWHLGAARPDGTPLAFRLAASQSAPGQYSFEIGRVRT
jgi:hypothetical protein